LHDAAFGLLVAIAILCALVSGVYRLVKWDLATAHDTSNRPRHFNGAQVGGPDVIASARLWAVERLTRPDAQRPGDKRNGKPTEDGESVNVQHGAEHPANVVNLGKAALAPVAEVVKLRMERRAWTLLTGLDVMKPGGTAKNLTHNRRKVDLAAGEPQGIPARSAHQMP
jgi:hypothetical protein